MSSESKSSSLRWAIEELSKQKDELRSKLDIAQKREDTNSLIDEVYSQKEALEKRISSLEDAFKASSKLVDEPVNSIEAELDLVNDKLDIAQDRLNSLEQEEYLEILGRKLSGDFPSDDEQNTAEIEQLVPDQTEITESPITSTGEIDSISDQETTLKSASVSPTPTLMKSPSNRIRETINEDIQTEVVSQVEIAESVKLEDCEPATLQSLHQCAQTLGVESEFLLNKGIQSILRMVARNGNKLSFPLEVKQID